MPHSPDQVHAAVVQVIGIAAAVVQVRRLTPDEGRAEVAAVVAGLTAAERRVVLDDAYVLYDRPVSAGAEPWYPEAVAFLATCGAGRAW